MHRGWESDPDEHDRIADALHRLRAKLHAEADESPDPVAQRRRANRIAADAERYRDWARLLRRPADQRR
jgi:hypothetical protein